jgi:hypothetical protein
MELNFDKEMDALLRQAARGGEFVSTGATTHLDADEISAFAENALPERARAVYMKHLADCDRCRSVLSNLILLSAEAETETASVLAPVIAEAKTPWYRRIFAVPNLAYTLGGLVILFGGFLGFLVLQSTNNYQNTEVLRVAEDQPRVSGPNIGSGEAVYNSNTMSLTNTANTSTNSAANTSIATSNMMTTNTSTSTTNANTATTTTTAPTPELSARESRDVQQPKTEEQTGAKPQLNEAKTKNDKDLAAADQNLAQEKEAVKLAPAPAKSAPAAPPVGTVRSELADKKKARTLSKEDGKTVAANENTRQISGKTFNRRDGAWYDAAFSGQGTTNVRRNTENYRKLDKGLRIIAESLEGTVVVVWKEKAYRIQ